MFQILADCRFVNLLNFLIFFWFLDSFFSIFTNSFSSVESCVRSKSKAKNFSAVVSSTGFLIQQKLSINFIFKESFCSTSIFSKTSSQISTVKTLIHNWQIGGNFYTTTLYFPAVLLPWQAWKAKCVINIKIGCFSASFSSEITGLISSIEASIGSFGLDKRYSSLLIGFDKSLGIVIGSRAQNMALMILFWIFF